MLLRLAALTALVLAPSQAMAEWYEAKTNHFIIYSQQKPEELRKYATQLERFDSGVRAVRLMKDPPPTSTNRLTLYVVRDAEDVADALGARGSGIAGVYFGRASGPVSIANSEPKRSKLVPRRPNRLLSRISAPSDAAGRDRRLSDVDG